MPERDELIRYGKLGRPHGVRGEVRLFLYNTHSDLLEEGMEVVLISPQDERESIVLDTVRPAGKFWLISLLDVFGREEVARWCNWELAISASALPPLEDEEEFYQADLVGLDVFERGEGGELGRRLGSVRGFFETGADEIMIVEERRPKFRLLVPMSEEAIEALEPGEGRVVLHPLTSWAWEGAGGEE